MFKNKFMAKAIVFTSIFGIVAGGLAYSTTSYSQSFRLPGLKKIKKFKPRIPRGLRPDKIIKRALPRVLGQVFRQKGMPRGLGVVLGVMLANAPHSFQKEMGRTYRKDWKWSGCTNCGTRRVVSAPSRKVSKKRKAEIRKQVKGEVRELQTALKTLKYYRSRVDGAYGKGTRRAIRKFQKDISVKATGTLNAEQRSRLFEKATAAGMVKSPAVASRALPAIAKGPTVVAAAVAVQKISALTPQNVPIKNASNYNLTNSQFQKFTKQYLMAGKMSVVQNASINASGVMEISTEEKTANGLVKRQLIGDTQNLVAEPHDLSDEWVRLVFYDQNTDRAYSLNTRDDFSDAAEAASWVTKARKKITLLAKLTGRKTIERDAPVAGKIIVASNETATASNDAAATAVSNEAATASNEVTAIATSKDEQNCREKVYLSFKFPEGEKPISHYNITPPEDVLMMDNGDSTAYFMGNCTSGDYNYKYVYISNKKSKKSWKHHTRKGSFKLASNTSQCQIDLLGSNSTANVTCY